MEIEDDARFTQTLKRRHAELEVKLSEARKSPSTPDHEIADLKRQKLQVKDAIHGHYLS